MYQLLIQETHGKITCANGSHFSVNPILHEDKLRNVYADFIHTKEANKSRTKMV